MENRHGLCVGVAVHGPQNAEERAAVPGLTKPEGMGVSRRQPGFLSGAARQR